MAQESLYNLRSKIVELFAANLSITSSQVEVVMKAMAEAAQARTAAGAIGRLAHPSEIASAVAFFAARESSFTTGQHIGVSGGMAML